MLAPFMSRYNLSAAFLVVCVGCCVLGCNGEPPLRLKVPESTRSLELRFYETMSDCPTDSGTGAILDSTLTVLRPASKLIRSNSGDFFAQDDTTLSFPDSENTQFVLGVIARNANCSLIGYRCIPSNFDGNEVELEVTAMPPTGGGCGGSTAYACTDGLCELNRPLDNPLPDGDEDQDLIPNWVECCPAGEECGRRGDFDPLNCPLVDSDNDGFADFIDTDADGDRVLDRSECSDIACAGCGNVCGGDCFDCRIDGGFLAFRSLDSDGDGASDKAECAVDGDTAGELCLDSDNSGVMDHLEPSVCCHPSCSTPTCQLDD